MGNSQSEIGIKNQPYFTIDGGIELIRRTVDVMPNLDIQDIGTVDECGKEKIIVKLCLKDRNWIFVCNIDDEWLDMKACFDRPQQLKPEFVLKCLNCWNEKRRFTRMTVDTEDDLWLRSDLPISRGNTEYLLCNFKEALRSFISAMIQYQSFILVEASVLEKKTKVDIRVHTKLITCSKEHTHEKCVLCFDRFQENEICLELNCGHFFHRQEIEKHLYNTACCPLCKRMIHDPPPKSRLQSSLRYTNISTTTKKRTTNEKYEKEETKNMEID